MERQAVTYFIREIGAAGPVKIGHSICPQDRLKAFQASSPVLLGIVATIDGGLSVERRFHALLAAYHSHHEWFLPTPEVEAVVAAVAGGAFDLKSLPEPRLLPPVHGHTDASRSAARYQMRLNAMVARGENVPAEVLAARNCYRLPPTETERRRAIVRAFVDQTDGRAA